ncbi:hypothetical protein GCM10020256_19230 [Streptomyces thermocoprophilus]
MEEVAVEDAVQGVGDMAGVAQPGRDEGLVEMAVRGVVLVAAQFEGAVGGLGEIGGCHRG